MFFYVQNPQIGAPSAPSFEYLMQNFQAHPVIGVMVTIAFIMVFLVMFRFSDILGYFKDRAVKKEDLEIKKLETDEKRHDDMMKAIDNMTKVVDNNTAAISSVEKSILISDAKMAERFSNISRDMLGMEYRLNDKIHSSVKEAEHSSRLDKIARLSKPDSDGEESNDGDHR